VVAIVNKTLFPINSLKDNHIKEYPLYKFMRDNKTTVVKLTPSHLALIKDIDNRQSSIKTIIVGYMIHKYDQKNDR